MSNIYVMVGLPGSGKSTYAENLRDERVAMNESAVVLSSDAYRKMLLGDESSQENNSLIFDTLYSDMRSYLVGGIDNLILDMTNTTVKCRKRIFEQIKKACPNMSAVNVVACVIATTVDAVVERDANRERSVGREVIGKFLSSFQFPQKFEGFNHIWIVSNVLGEFREDFDVSTLFNVPLYQTIAERACAFDQMNPHHAYTLGEHCSKVAMYLRKKNPRDDAGFKAACIHDIGKMMTQTIDENGVAHYYSHDSVGAYYLACNLDIIPECSSWDELFEVLFYVNYHMRAHNDFKHEKAERKYRALFGDERFDRLMTFGECDRLGNGTSIKEEER